MREAAVVILNFNGTNDTIECLKSIYKFENKNRFSLIIFDNNSIYTEINKLEKYICDLEEYRILVCNYETYINLDISSFDIILVKNDRNLGFAAGNNAAINPHRKRFKYFFLLNNDTEMVSSAISNIINYMKKDISAKIVTTAIYYFYNKERIWNAGGKLFWGTRKYYREKYLYNLLKKGKTYLQVDFVTGCFFGIRADDIPNEGIYTEQFFFGEEDYNFSMIAKKKNYKMIVLLKEKILHKVGATIGKEKENENVYVKFFVHHLNRFIDMRNFYTKTKWHIWKCFASGYIFLIIFKESKNIKTSLDYIFSLNYLSLKMNKVTYEDFMMIRNNQVSDLKSIYRS